MALTAHTNEKVLLQRARTGDQQAFGSLVHRYEAQVRGIIRGMVGNSGELDDIVQEVFVRFYRSLDRFRGDAQLSTYLGRIAINASLTAIEKRKKRRWLPWQTEDGSSAEWDRADDHADPRRSDLRDLLQQALAQLSKEYRSVVVLRLVEGYSVVETADMLNIPQGTVASRLARAQKQLRKLIGPVLNME